MMATKMRHRLRVLIRLSHVNNCSFYPREGGWVVTDDNDGHKNASR